MVKALWLVAVVACSGSDKAVSAPGSGSAPAVVTGECAGARAHVEQLYRAEAQAKEPKRVDEAVADNTAMAMNDCAKDPARRAACLESAASVAALEKDCLIPLDPEGTEGERR